MNRRRALTLIAAFACAPRLASAAEWRGTALGADVSIALSGPRDRTEAALAAIPAKLERIEALFSLYREDSALARLNRLGVIAAPRPFLDLAAAVDHAHRMTGGLFDPTVQSLWRALSAGRDPTEAPLGWQCVRRAGGDICLAPGQALTFNGIAQGYATDLIRADLARQGFTQALVDIGEYAALGGPYVLGIEDPAHGLVGLRKLRDGAIATSSPDATLMFGRPHIQAPDGRPPLWSTVSVEARWATLADAFSTAAIFMDRAELLRLKREAGLTRITAVGKDGATVKL